MANPTLSAITWDSPPLVSVWPSCRSREARLRGARSGGNADPGAQSVGKRAWVVSAALTHRESGLPPLGSSAPTGLVMVSFLIPPSSPWSRATAQLRIQTFHAFLPATFAPWEGFTEVLAWGVARHHPPHACAPARRARVSAAEAALSNDDPDGAAAAGRPKAPASSLAKPHPRDSPRAAWASCSDPQSALR